MAMKNRIVAFVAGVMLGPAIVWAGLETGTYISDLVATNPLSSDLASTADDHIRLLKSTIKTTFPNINGAVTATDEQLAPGGLAANPGTSIGLTATNGVATTYMRSDGAPALSQAIAPTWTGHHIFSNSFTGGNPGALTLSANDSVLEIDQSNASADERRWHFRGASGQLLMQTKSDDRNTGIVFMQVDRTGTTVDRVTFPTDSAARNLQIGTQANVSNGFIQARTTQTLPALAIGNPAAAQATLTVNNEATSGNNIFITFLTEAMTSPSTRGNIDYDRAGTAVRYNTTSDIRLKKNFKSAPSARKVIDCIKVESYDWKESNEHVEHGFVAQRLNECAPYAVSSSDDPKHIWGVDPSKLVPALIKYVQEQDARISRLEADAARRH